MVKLRKQRRKKRYRAHINRKRLYKRTCNKGAIINDVIRKAWDERKLPKRNLIEMGLVYDPNSDLKKSNARQVLRSSVIATSEWITSPIDHTKSKPPPRKHYVADKLLAEANAPLERMFRMRLRDVEWVTYLMDKYGFDYKAMAKDKRNYQQETWKQIRGKIKSFMGVPDQYAEYLEKKGQLNTDVSEGQVRDFIEAADIDSD